jgi:8-oxo-dGTP diphosphatase
MSDASPKIAVAIAVVEYRGCYLAGRRSEGAPLAGLWEFPGGKIEPGESAEQAAARECLEEAGLRILVGPAYPVVDHQYAHARVRLTFFACAPIEPAVPPKPPFEWLSLARLGELPFPAANRSLIQQLTEHGSMP